MNDENLHIAPDPHKGIPEPDIPADEAWNNMSKILDAEMPGSPNDPGPSQKPPSSGGGGLLGGSIQFWSAGLIILGVAGIVTWGVLRHTNKPEPPVQKQETVNVIQNKTIADSLPSGKQSNPSPAGNIKFPSAKATHGTTIDQPGKRPEKDITVQSKTTSGTAIIAGNEQSPGLTSASITRPSETATRAIVPSQTTTDSLMTTVNTTSRQNPVIDEILKDTVNVAEANKTQNDAGIEKPKKSRGVPGNLSWQAGVSGNIGEVVQKGRNPNLYYGAMLTGGLFLKKLKAGIETGIGWTEYNDYGSVTNNIRITDSIPGDTVHPVTHIDTSRISSSRYRYQYLQIPLFLSKQIAGKGNFVFNIRTGPVIGFLISQKQVSGSTSGPENGEILSTVNNDYARLKLSWQWHLMVEFQWNLNDRLFFTLSPSGIFYLNNLYESTNRPPNIPFGIGVNAGLIYRFK